MNWPHSAIAIRIATPARTVVAGSGERRARERCEHDREQADCEYGAGGEQSVSAAHPRHHPCRRYLRHDDEEGVDEDDDTDLTGPDRRMSHRTRREAVG